MITPLQIKALRTIVSRAGMEEASYRLMLHNVGEVGSCKDLDQAGYEDVMAFLEDHTGSKENYWRDKVRLRGTFAGTRMVHKIQQLFAEYQAIASVTEQESQQYKLPGLCARASGDRVRTPEQLAPREAWNLIESLKKFIARTVTRPSGSVVPNPHEAETLT